MRSTICRCPPGSSRNRSPVPSQTSSLAGPLHGEVARRRFLGQVARDVGAGDLQLVLVAEAHAHARQRHAHRVLARTRPGGVMVRPPVPSVMPKPLHSSMPVGLEEAEDRRFEVAGGRQAPGQPVTGDRPQRGADVAALAGRLEGAVADLLPAQRDADQAGRAHARQLAQEGLGRRVAGEDVGAAPEEHAEQFEVATEGVEQRQVAEQQLVGAHARQRRRAGEALADDVVLREGDPLGPAGAAAGEHHRARLAQAEARARREPPVDLRRGEVGEGRLDAARRRRRRGRAAAGAGAAARRRGRAGRAPAAAGRDRRSPGRSGAGGRRSRRATRWPRAR